MSKYCWILLAATVQAADPWADLRAKNPTGPAMELRLAGPPVFRQGELIRIVATRPRLDEPEWQFGGFLIAPVVADCGTIAKPCVNLRPMMGVRSGPASVEPPPFVFNDHVRDLLPGTYAVAALLRKGLAFVVSNTLEIEVQPADAAWTAEAVARTVAVLRNGRVRTRAEYDALTKASEQLGLLDQPAAWRGALDVLPVGETILLTRLTETRDPNSVCQLMQARVSAPEQSVSRHYLEALTRVCKQANVDVDASASLAGSLARKRPEVKTAGFQALLEYLRQTPAPVWTPGFYREFARAFDNLDAGNRPYLLNMFASTAPAGIAIPLLESVLDAWKPGDFYEAAHSAIRSLHRLDPARAHARLRAELTKPRTWLDTPLLALLPASAVPAMDDVLIREDWNSQLRRAALARYASPKVLPRMKAMYESQADRCQPELMAYFVRVDPSFAESLLHKELSDMHAPAPPCTTQYFARTAALVMHPVLEKYIAAYLNHGTVMVKMLAARSLGTYGSASAKPPLWDAYRYFHEYWKGKKAALEKNGEGVVLEVELRNAISRGTNWSTSETELRTMESLCISDQCRRETRGDLRASQPPIPIEIYEGPFGLQASVGHYIGMQGIDAIRARLARFPPGTKFKVTALGQAARQVAAELKISDVR